MKSKRKKVYNDFLPAMNVEGSFDHPDYVIDWQIPRPVHPSIFENKKEQYDCLLDPFASLLIALGIVNEVY